MAPRIGAPRVLATRLIESKMAPAREPYEHYSENERREQVNGRVTIRGVRIDRFGSLKGLNHVGHEFQN